MYIYIKKSNEIRMLVHIKEIIKKRTKRIFHNILVLTFSPLLQIFRYNVYNIYIYVFAFLIQVIPIEV
jgi:hypothetical protein